AVRYSYLPTLGAQLALARRDSQKAVEFLEAARPYELAVSGLTFNTFAGGMHPVYVRGMALLAAGNAREAAMEFEKIVAHPGLVLADPVGALARLQLGRAYVLVGDPTKARAAYEEFLALWQGADSDVPLYRQAKAEYAKLR